MGSIQVGEPTTTYSDHGLPLTGISGAGNKPPSPTRASNRKKVQKLLDRIEADIAAGAFDYRRYFPASKNAARFDAAPAVSVRRDRHRTKRARGSADAPLQGLRGNLVSGEGGGVAQVPPDH